MTAPPGARLPRKHADAAFRPERIIARADDLAHAHLDVGEVAARFGEKGAALHRFEVFAHRFARHGKAIKVQQVADFQHHGGDTARVPEVLHRVTARGLGVGEYRYLAVDAVEVVYRDVNAAFARDHGQVQQRVCRATNCRVNGDGVLERLPREDSARAQIGFHQFENLLAHGAGDAQMIRQRRGNERASRQREAERLRERLPRARAAHELAGATGRARAMLM